MVDGDGSIDGLVEDPQRAIDGLELVRVEPLEQLPQLALVRAPGTARAGRRPPASSVTTTWRRSAGSSWRRRKPSSTRRSTRPLADDDPTPSRAASSDMRSSPAAMHDVQDLGLRHRDRDLGELRCVALDEPVHQRVVALDDGFDAERVAVSVRIGRKVRSLRTIRTCHTISSRTEPRVRRRVRAGPSFRTIGSMTPRHALDRATARRFLAVRHLLAPAARAARRAGVGAARRRTPRIAPVRPARGDRPEPRPRARGPDRRLPSGPGPTTTCMRSRTLYETYNKGLSIVPTRELPWYRITWDLQPRRARRQPPSTSTRRWSRSCSIGSGATARCRRPTSSHAPRSTGTGGRRTRSARSSRHSPRPASWGSPGASGNRRVYDLAERLFPADLLAERRPTREQRRHKLLSRYRAHGLLGRSGSAELWLGTAPGGARSAADRTCRPGRSSSRSSSRTDRSSRSTVEGVRGERFVLGRRARPASMHGRLAEVRPATPVAPARRRGLPRAARPVRLGPRPPARRCTTSTTSGRCTSRPPGAAGATTSCRSCSATGSSAASNRASTARPARCASSTCGGRHGFDPIDRRPGSRTRSPTPSRRTRASAACERIVLPRTARHRALGAGGPRAARARRPGQGRRLTVLQRPQLPALSRARTRTS